MKKGSKRIVVAHGNRLVVYYRVPNIAFWSNYWSRVSVETLVRNAKRDRVLGGAFIKYLPKEGLIIEAGCGLAQWVKALRDVRYDVIGLDFSIESIIKAKRCYPELPLIVGDVMRLPFRDNVFSGVICLGVVEHFPEGPRKVIKELYRVLKCEGILFISVPYLNPLRRLKMLLGCYRNRHLHNLPFYQYIFSRKEFSSILRESGFEIVDVIPYDPLKGLADEIPIIKPCLKRVRLKSKTAIRKRMKWQKKVGILKLIRYSMGRLLAMITGHMILFVARKRCPPMSRYHG